MDISDGEKWDLLEISEVEKHHYLKYDWFPPTNEGNNQFDWL